MARIIFAGPAVVAAAALIQIGSLIDWRQTEQALLDLLVLGNVPFLGMQIGFTELASIIIGTAWLAVAWKMRIAAYERLLQKINAPKLEEIAL